MTEIYIPSPQEGFTPFEKAMLASEQKLIFVSGQRGPIAELCFLEGATLLEKMNFVTQVMEQYQLALEQKKDNATESPLTIPTTHDPLFITKRKDIEHAYHTVGIDITERLNRLEQITQTRTEEHTLTPKEKIPLFAQSAVPVSV